MNEEQMTSYKLQTLNTTMHDLIREQGDMLLRVLEETRQQNTREIDALARRLDHITKASKEALKEGKDNAEKLVALHEQRSTMGYSSDAPPQSGNSSLALSTNTSLSNSPVKHQPAVPNIFNSDVDEDGATMSQHSIRPPTAESSASQTILVQVTNCQDLVVPHLLGSTDPFVVTYVFWNGEKIGETETIWFGTAHPSWKNAVRNTFRIVLSQNEDLDSGVLSFEVHHTHRRGAGWFLGIAKVEGRTIQGMDDSFKTHLCRLSRKPESSLPQSKQLNVQGKEGVSIRLKPGRA
eukprot:FR736292.1.p1 GENE.FR736292.1~~FR736292.1.p1  ORF type:complete len:293 (+),score=19.40 FR736292.1:2-880(+)